MSRGFGQRVIVIAVDDREVVVGHPLGDVGAGSHEMTFAPSGKLIICSTPAWRAIRLRWASWTPFGGPVVPEV